MSKSISGFSKMNKRQKIRWLVEHFFADPEAAARELMAWWHPSEEQQKVLDGFTENALTNFPLPFSIAPNFKINGKVYAVPMVIEESSVVAAAASAAKFWYDRGGFFAEVIDTVKLGQVHFRWHGKSKKLFALLPELKKVLYKAAEDLTVNMRKRGGGILDVELLDFTDREPFYYQLRVSFDTRDSMGANFINSVLECFARTLEQYIENHSDLLPAERAVEVIMSILSNYTPNCLVRAWVECPIEQLEGVTQSMDAPTFADRFATAVRIAAIDPYRATTHNKGIFNGIDSVILATGNDFRAIEACGHTHACKNGAYTSLSRCSIVNGRFYFALELPLAVGTVGGLTSLHPLAKKSLELLGNPSAKELMCIVAAVGLSQNFAAVKSLVTTGIQKGHMKMHLTNILNHLTATDAEKTKTEMFFSDKTVSFSAVRDFLENERTLSAVKPSK